ncbi:MULTISPECIES: hypothetical protein [Streptomyces]|uniref:hypothetical protein n=1 Tax=Streptomyces TaxID=1883 RepID=UPI00163C21C3|nr:MULTISPECIES: hypothetical protein [Streptomyces]MBC2879783.1 hypothetical protein [Streptomyces sp. TYQ1024]UBI41391.1 hypothetical protein K7I03_33530 [Streptomyces mobaraensis]
MDPTAQAYFTRSAEDGHYVIVVRDLETGRVCRIIDLHQWEKFDPDAAEDRLIQTGFLVRKEFAGRSRRSYRGWEELSYLPGHYQAYVDAI